MVLSLISFIVILTMVFSFLNIVTAVLIVRKFEGELKKLETKNIFNHKKNISLYIWFIVFSILVSALQLLVNAENLQSIGLITDERMGLAIKFFCVEGLTSLMVFQYHMMLLLKKDG